MSIYQNEYSSITAVGSVSYSLLALPGATARTVMPLDLRRPIETRAGAGRFALTLLDRKRPVGVAMGTGPELEAALCAGPSLTRCTDPALVTERCTGPALGPNRCIVLA